jgi:hypothetical protein
VKNGDPSKQAKSDKCSSGLGGHPGDDRLLELWRQRIDLDLPPNSTAVGLDEIS